MPKLYELHLVICGPETGDSTATEAQITAIAKLDLDQRVREIVDQLLPGNEVLKDTWFFISET